MPVHKDTSSKYIMYIFLLNVQHLETDSTVRLNGAWYKDTISKNNMFINYFCLMYCTWELAVQFVATGRGASPRAELTVGQVLAL